MKNIKHLMLLAAAMLLTFSCSDDDVNPGNPILEPKTEIGTAMFGDSLLFTVNVSDTDVPLSTLKAQLFYSEEKVSETIIRTKTNDDYTGKIFIPYYANIPDASATLKLVLQNIHFTVTEKEYMLPLTRPDYPYITLVTEELDANGHNVEYRMERQDPYSYSVTADFPQKVKAWIKTPKLTSQANEMVFGWGENGIVEGTTDLITFSSSTAGQYTISFNTFNYEASPFLKLEIDGNEMEMVDANTYRIDLNLKPEQEIEITGIPDLSEWWIDPDFFERQDNGKLKFLPLEGDFRIIADFARHYFRIQAVSGGAPATLQADGSGAIWVIGNGLGKPALKYAPGWTTENALCMAQVKKGVYRITGIAGVNLSANDVNFKFFPQMGWDNAFTSDRITTNSDVIRISTTTSDNGNIMLVEGKTLDMMGVYSFTVDVTGGLDKAVLTVKKEGEAEVETTDIKFDGMVMSMVDADNYKVEKELTQNQSIDVTGINDLAEWWIDPDYFAIVNGKATFLPVSGKYRVTANLAHKYFIVEAMNGNDLASLQSDGTGAIWAIGYDIGKPSLANQMEWDTGKGLCMAPVGNKKYQLTLEAGRNINLDKIEFKLFHQKGWGGEFTDKELTTGSDLVVVKDGGNLALVEGKTLEAGAHYVFTVDLSGGNSNAVLTVVKK